MQKRMLFLFVAAAALLGACSKDYKKTKSGLLYKIYSDEKGQMAKKGQIIKLHFRQKIKDSVLQETYDGVPGYAMVDSLGPVYNAAELFPQLRKGDSLVVVMIGDSVQKKFGQLPPYMKKEDRLTLTFKVIEIFPDAQAATNDRTSEWDKEKTRQEAVFAKYIASKKNLQKAPLGTYVDVKTQGDGPKVEVGKLVSVLYTGKNIPSEKIFESNMNTPGAPPIEFVVGGEGIIKGWNDGLVFFNKGGKGTIYVPAELAYGAQPGPDGKVHQSLAFDIEIVDVKDAPKGSGMPNSIPQVIPNDTTDHKGHNH